MSDAEEANEDCPLCLCPMEQYDQSHPLQCPSRHCHFNCCMDCLEHMIKSTKDEPTEAADGNVFRVFLHCPNCRSNLGPSIRDTVLLRKVDKYSTITHLKTNDGVEVVDECLPASELRFKYALQKDEDVSKAIEQATSREDEFFGKGSHAEDEDGDGRKTGDQPLDLTTCYNLSGTSAGSIWSFDDEEGYEADLSGRAKSFIFRHHSVENLSAALDHQDSSTDLDDIKADSTLLCGLDSFMTDQEQQYITAQLISGDTARLAAATEMMHYISALSRQGIKPSFKRRQSSIKMVRKPSMKRSMLESIKEVIREGNEARRLEEEKQARHGAGVVAAQLQYKGLASGRRNQKMQVDIEMKRQIEYMKLHPLPLRMPKYAELTAGKTSTKTITFVDDVWDGTVLDAYSKIMVTKSLLGHIHVTKQHAESIGVRQVIEAGEPKSSKSKGKGYIDTKRPRVLVASINREFGHQGVVKGDVVTHFNGEAFTGSASELTEILQNRFEGELLTFVFNADGAVAEALKRRSMIADN